MGQGARLRVEGVGGRNALLGDLLVSAVHTRIPPSSQGQARLLNVSAC